MRTMILASLWMLVSAWPVHAQVQSKDAQACINKLNQDGAATALQFVATTRTLASNISLIVALETLFVMILAHGLLGERAHLRGWVGAVMAFAGVGLITVDPTTLTLGSSEHMQGNVLMMASVLCYAVYTLTGKALCERWGSAALTALPFAITTIVMVPAFAWLDPAGFERALHPTAAEWRLIVLVAVIGAGAGYLIWNWLLRFMSAGSISLSLYFQPVAGILFSSWFLAEHISGAAVAGAGLILGGVALSELRR